MQKVLLLLVATLSFACNTSKEQIIGAALMANESAITATADQESIIEDTKKLKESAKVLDLTYEELGRARVTLQALIPTLGKMTASSNKEVSKDARTTLELVKSASARMKIALPAIKASTESIRKSAESTKDVVKKVKNASETIIDKAEGVVNTKSGFWGGVKSFFGSIFGWFGSTLSLVILVVVGIVVVTNLPSILMGIKMFTGILIPKRHNDMAALLHDALHDPDQGSVESMAALWRADRGHEAAYQRLKRKKQAKLAKPYIPPLDDPDDSKEGEENTS